MRHAGAASVRPGLGSLPGLVLALALAMQAAVATASSGWPALPWPPGLRPQVIADDMRFNGNPVRLYRFDDPRAPGTVAEKLRVLYGRHARITVIGERHIVAAPMKDTLVTIDLQPGDRGGTRGHVMQTRLARSSPAAPAMPVASQLWSHSESTEGRNSATVLMLENQHTAADNAEFYRQHYTARGLTRAAVQHAAPPRKAITAHYTGHGQTAVVLVEDWGPFRSVIVQHTREIP